MRMRVDNLHFSYGSHEVLKGVSFGVEDSGFVSLLGPNGAGKSTLFRCMLGLLEPSEGTVHICGRDIRSMPAAELSHRVAYIPQSHSPVFNFSVFDMVLMGTTAQLSQFASPGRAQQRLAEAARLGFKKCIIPRNGAEKLEIPEGLSVFRVRNLREAIEMAL